MRAVHEYVNEILKSVYFSSQNAMQNERIFNINWPLLISRTREIQLSLNIIIYL